MAGIRRLTTEEWLKLENLPNRHERRKRFYRKDKGVRDFVGLTFSDANMQLTHKEPFRKEFV